jgi:hypothetical protein
VAQLLNEISTSLNRISSECVDDVRTDVVVVRDLFEGLKKVLNSQVDDVWKAST